MKQDDLAALNQLWDILDICLNQDERSENVFEALAKLRPEHQGALKRALDVLPLDKVKR